MNHPLPTGSRVYVGLSGGVDSAVSAALLKKQGYSVTGVFIRIAIEGLPCPAAEDRRSAMRAAAHLNIPFKEVNLSREYEERIFDMTIAAYVRGETPNPDVWCNREIKFGLFFDWCMKEGAAAIATGHYARICPEGDRTHLYAAADEQKDQTYFLCEVPEEKLAKTVFPIGGMRKGEVRAMALHLGLPNAQRPDSQGLCFLGELSIEDVLRKKMTIQPGDVLDKSGAVIGSHQGAALYTIGQRHGFLVPAHTHDKGPLYVIAKNMAQNTITVSSSPDTPTDMFRVTLDACNWIGDVHEGQASARVRYRQLLFPVAFSRSENAAAVTSSSVQHVAAGQIMALYRAEKNGVRCLGGGIMTP